MPNEYDYQYQSQHYPSLPIEKLQISQDEVESVSARMESTATFRNTRAEFSGDFSLCIQHGKKFGKQLNFNMWHSRDEEESLLNCVKRNDSPYNRFDVYLPFEYSADIAQFLLNRIDANDIERVASDLTDETREQLIDALAD